MQHYYQDIQGWFDWEDIYRQVIVDAQDGDTIVEVGTWKGKSLSFLLVEAANSGKKLNIVGVDHFLGSIGEPALQREAAADFGEPLKETCIENVRRAGYDRWRLSFLESTRAALDFADGSLAFVFLDGSHDYESVKADIAAWRPKVRPKGGVLAGHDADRPTVLAAVIQAFGQCHQLGSCWLVRM